MAKYTYTDNNISFSNITVDQIPFKMIGGKMQSSLNDYAEGDITPFINAVEIDWNSATLGDKVINSTGEVGCSILVPSVC